MPRTKRAQSQGCEVDMTPMIDVVFQLIIFFIVTIKMDESKNEKIELEPSPHGPIITDASPREIVIEIDKRGWISIRGAQLTPEKLRGIMINRYRKFGEFPVLIRGDYRAKHQDIRRVMDICTEANIWRINFAAVFQDKTP